MTPRDSHGTLNDSVSQLGCFAESEMMLNETTSPSAVPTTMAVSATNDDSSRKAAWIMRRWKPMERSTPICWRRSTTARALITPSRGADDQAQAHEALDDVVERLLRAHHIVECLLQRVCLDAVGEKCSLDLPCRFGRRLPVAEPEQ